MRNCYVGTLPVTRIRAFFFTYCFITATDIKKCLQFIKSVNPVTNYVMK
jgi:hypothetical protein